MAGATRASASTSPPTSTSVKDLVAEIETIIDAWNERSQPFIWTKTANEIFT